MQTNIHSMQRKILRALFHSTEIEDENIRWRHFRFDHKKLTRQLSSLSGELSPDFIKTLSERYGLTVLRTDDLTLNIHGFERKFDRQMIAESLGAAGVQFFPTRQSALRAAFESTRELLYFGYGPIENQCLACPIQYILSSLVPNTDAIPETTMLRDLREGFSTNETLFELIQRDENFHTVINTPDELQHFQTNLRKYPLSVQAEEKCEDFFNKKVTIGPRDSIRWLLGSRHPRFSWECGQAHIQTAFEHHAYNNFNTPQIVYYADDPSIDEMDIEAMHTHNHEVVCAFSKSLEQSLKEKSPSILKTIQSHLYELSSWILDIHHDYPDFDLETEGRLGATTHIDFIGHSIQNKVNQELLGNDSETRRNRNMSAHFQARRIDKRLLSKLSESELSTLYDIIDQLILDYDLHNGLEINGEFVSYKRVPCVLFLIQDLGNPKPEENEKLLDTFTLSQVTELEHASHIRTYEDISEQLVVFFMLTLRHMIETEHVPDLQPRNFTRDFIILGLWGIRTPNLKINLYIDKNTDDRDPTPKLTRSELRFIGTEQVETHPLAHIRKDAKALRFAISRLAPQIEPAILRNIGTFVMAMEEFHSSSQAFQPNAMTALHYLLDTAREVTNWGLRGSVMDVLTVFEYMADSSVNHIQYGLNFLNKKVKSNEADKPQNK